MGFWESIPWALLAAAAVIGFVVGMTGMGGGALMTPVLVLFFGVPPLTAVSSDLVASAVMKPFGSVVHLRRGTVDLSLVLWLVVGSVPSAFAGVLILRALGDVTELQSFVKTALGVALLIAVAGILFRVVHSLFERTRPGRPTGAASRPYVVRRTATVIVGVIAGLMVGLTSVGSGSLVIVALMLLYPALLPNRLVGTDLAQAVPLVFAAALGHILFGDVDWSIAIPISLGSIPGVLLGARLSSAVPAGYVRRALAVILFASGLKLLGASNEATLVAVVLALLLGTVAWMLLRRSRGLPALARMEKPVDHPAGKIEEQPREEPAEPGR